MQKHAIFIFFVTLLLCLQTLSLFYSAEEYKDKNYLRVPVPVPQRSRQVRAEDRETVSFYRERLQDQRRVYVSDFMEEQAKYSVLRAGTPVLDYKARVSSDITCYASSAAHMRYRFGKKAGKLPGDMVCIFSKLCISNGNFEVLVSLEDDTYTLGQDSTYFDFPPSLTSRRKVTPRTFNTDAELQAFWDKSAKKKESTWLVTHSYTRHLTHFMEHISPIFNALSRVVAAKFAWPSEIWLLAHPRNLLGWQNRVLKSIPYVTKVVTTEHIHFDTCFEQAFVPGYLFHIFQDSHESKFFQTSVLSHIDYTPIPNTRQIYFVKRSSKRVITNHAQVASLIITLSNQLDLPPTLYTAKQGKMSFKDQVAMTSNSNIFISIHGADLTNIMFLQPGSVVIEINPHNWRDSRFYLLSLAMDLTYLEYAQTDADLAFTGRQEMPEGRHVERDRNVEVDLELFTCVLMDAFYAVGWSGDKWPSYSVFK